MSREIVSTEGAPAAIGPYSQAVKAGGFLFLSGQIGLDPETGAMVQGGIQEETRQCLKNIAAVLAAAGVGLDAVVRCRVYLADIAEYVPFNLVYGEAFGEAPPARAAFEVAALPKSARVEIEAEAWLG